jgi:single-stranded DNA-binding protein
MSDTNLIIIAGNLGADLAIETTLESGRVKIKGAVATTEYRGNNNVTTWHNVGFFTSSDKQRDYLLAKGGRGSKVMVTGSLRTRKVPHSEHPVDITHVEIEASSLEIINSKPSASAVDSQTHTGQAQAPAQQSHQVGSTATVQDRTPPPAAAMPTLPTASSTAAPSEGVPSINW